MKMILIGVLMMVSGIVSQEGTCSADGTCEELSMTVEWKTDSEEMGAEVMEEIEGFAAKHDLSSPDHEIVGKDGSPVTLSDLGDENVYPITIKIMKPTAAADPEAEKKAEEERLAEEARMLAEEKAKAEEAEEKARQEEAAEKARIEAEKARQKEEMEREEREAEEARQAEEAAALKLKQEEEEAEQKKKEAEEAAAALAAAKAKGDAVEEARRLAEKEKADADAAKAKEEAEAAAKAAKEAEEEAARQKEEMQKTQQAMELHELKWRWADDLFPVPFTNNVVTIPKIDALNDKWNEPASRAALKAEIEEKLNDLQADKKRFKTRRVQIKDKVNSQTRIFENYEYLFQWLVLEGNVE